MSSEEKARNINRVSISGKISKVSPLRFTPTGLPLLEVIVAVPQEFLGESSIGYFDVMFTRDEALNLSKQLKIGRKVGIEGSLWSRRYKDRTGTWITERKVIAFELIKEKSND